jgi:hypothetical protein
VPPISAEAVARMIGQRNLLLLLDNCEHVIDAAATLTETILSLCPHATVLATSREILRASGEYVFRVPPLGVPPPTPEGFADLLGHSAAELFFARTRAQDAAFATDSTHLSAVAAICRHLDGIPLAILDAAAAYGTMLLEHTEHHPIRLWHIWARCFLALVAIKLGNVVVGLASLREELERAGDARFLPRFLLLLGNDIRRRVREGSTVTSAISMPSSCARRRRKRFSNYVTFDACSPD